MSNDPTASTSAADIRKRLDDARAAYLVAEKVALAARDAADAAGEPRNYGATNHDVHVAEREAVDALIDANDEYTRALLAWKAFVDLHE